MSSLKASPLILNPESIYLYSPAKVTHSVLRNTIVFPLNSTETLAAILVGDFKSDTTGPEISSISLDLNQGIFTILFDEPILGRSFLVNKVSFRSSYRGVSVYLTNHLTDLITNNSSMLAINLTTGDLNALKSSHYQAALDEVVLESFFVIDLFGNAPFNGIDQVVSLSIIQDVTPPVLTSCSFDLSTSIFNIYFDEIVDVSFIRTPTIRLSSSPFIGAYNLTLSNYSIVENYSSQSQRESNVSLNLALFREDSFRLQAHPTIGKLFNTTYIFLPNIRDLAGNVNPSLQSTQCQITPDTTSPSLESFDFIQFPGTIQIILFFSEVVSLSSFNCSHFLLLSEPSTSGEIYRPLDCSVVTSQDSRQIQYSFTDPSSFTLIGVSEQSTYLSILPITNVTDLSGNILTPISHNDALRVGPRVISYFLDMSIGKLTLIFSKDIDTTPATPFNGSTIGFYSLSSSKQSRLEESNSFLPYFDNSDDFEFVVVIPINPSDLIQLKSIRVAPSEVYLLMDSLSFADSNSVSSSPLSTSNQLIPTRLISDLDPPVIANITLDFSANILSFLVDEPLDILSFQFNLFVLQSRAGSLISPTLGSHRFTSGIVKQLLNHSFVTLQMVLSDADMTAIKLNEVLIANISTAYLSIGYGGLQDMSGNSLQILPEYARKISQYIPDATPPSLNSFSLNMNTGEMILHFSEPIDYTTVSPQEIVLQSRFSQGSSAAIHLSNQTEVFPKNGLAITLTLSDQDILNIKYADNLARKSISTYLTGSAAVAADLAGNPMNPILDGFALLVSTFIADSVRPFILKISLDLSEEVLTVHLSEPVETSSLDISAISILNKAVNSNLFYSFTNSSNQILSSDQFASILEFQLSVSDLNELKSLHPLGSSFQSTYFSVQSLFCKDVYQNPVIPISITSPMQVFEYHQDLVLPRLITSSLDMELELLLLQYSEAISFHSINISELIIQQTETKRYGNYINLTTCEVMVASDDSLLIVQFDRNTINQMKWKEIGSSASVSYISWSDSFVSDVFGNKLNPLWDGSVLGHHPILPTFYFPDSTSPTPLKWFSDRLSKTLVVIFSEPVNVINCSGLHLLLPSLPQPSRNISFNTCLVQYSDYGTKISINLSQATFLNLTSHEAITLLSKTRSGEVSLVIDNATISDLGNVKNYIRSWTLVETSPDCSPCPEGSFQYSQCTTLDDRVCRPCRSCGHQEWIFEECSPLQDRSCVACSDCRLGTYISSPCEQTKDTQCSQCTKCKDLEFQSRSCLFGLDALCDSCKFCSFGNTTVAKLCRTSSYFAWYEQHCCQNVDGLQTVCTIPYQ